MAEHLNLPQRWFRVAIHREKNHIKTLTPKTLRVPQIRQQGYARHHSTRPQGANNPRHCVAAFEVWIDDHNRHAERAVEVGIGSKTVAGIFS
ncbi:MAG: hypothetical protein WBE03_15775 [Terracidiphilus sp.]